MKDASITQVKYEYPALPDWAVLGAGGATIPPDAVTCIAVEWENTGDEDLDGKLSLDLVDPDGYTWNLVPDVYHLVLVPGAKTWIYFDNLQMTVLGDYTVNGEITEQGDTTVLDSFSYPITVSSGSVPSTDTTEIITSIMPIVMLMMVMGMLTPMMKGMSK